MGIGVRLLIRLMTKILHKPSTVYSTIISSLGIQGHAELRADLQGIGFRRLRFVCFLGVQGLAV